ncbi:cysteine-rich CWC family protein [Paenibacillus luteus]
MKAVNEDQANCWCFYEKFPQELLQQLPDEQRGKACICKSCLDTFQASRK